MRAFGNQFPPEFGKSRAAPKSNEIEARQSVLARHFLCAAEFFFTVIR